MKYLIVISFVVFLFYSHSFASENYSSTPPIIEGFNEEILVKEAQNIVYKVAHSPAGSVAVICSKEKEDFASWITHQLEKQKTHYRLLKLDDKSDSNFQAIRSFIKDVTGEWGLIFLMQPEDASFLFENIGSPMTGFHISEEHLFCDWLMPTPGLIRLYSADQKELEDFRRALLAEINGAKKIHVTTEKGTDIHIEPRSWIVSDGEIFTAVDEQKSNGTVFVDGCAYMGPPKKPFLLRIENGRVYNLSDMDETDKQQGFVRNDLTKDENANVLAELGIGTSINSKWDSQMMESEQARGTVHFGFGANTMFEGGQNESSQHTDYIILKPTIVVDGRCICKDGIYQFE